MATKVLKRKDIKAETGSIHKVILARHKDGSYSVWWARPIIDGSFDEFSDRAEALAFFEYKVNYVTERF